jgi:FAD-dependent halogenase
MKKQYDIIVVGGGPAGCTAASYLARDGYSVALFERETHPRHRIGESLLPSLMPIIEEFGLIDECERRGFQKKPGATFTWGKSDEPWHLKWKENPFLPYSFAYHVERSSFDEMLANYAKSVGVEMFENIKVTGPICEDDSNKKVIGINWEDSDKKSHQVFAKFVIDCSGSASVIGRQVSNRVYDDKMKQVALYTYFDNVNGPDPSESEEIHEHIIITTCPKGWFWWIPINSKDVGYVSCGLVTGQEFKSEFMGDGKGGPTKFYYDALEECPRVKKMIGDQAKQTQPMRMVTDWSYSCDVTAGDGFFLCGDAAAFLDPLISTGVSLAMLSAYSASVCINTILSEPSKQDDVVGFYQRNYKQMYEVTRDFLHYFYAGATSAYQDELFWKGRSNLRLGENVGAKQAFTYFTAIIPGNPHPAVSKQISLFKNMMDKVEFPKEKLEQEMSAETVWKKTKEVSINEIEHQTRLLVNGRLEKSFTIDSKSRKLIEAWGIAYDTDRPVLSNTASWLMGQNFYPVDQSQLELLKNFDGQRTWQNIEEEVGRSGNVIDFKQALESLCNNRLVLKIVS